MAGEFIEQRLGCCERIAVAWIPFAVGERRAMSNGEQQRSANARGVPIWTVVVAALGAAVLGGLVVVLATGASDESEGATTTSSTLPTGAPIDECFEELYSPALSYGESNGDAELNAVNREIAMTYGLQSDVYRLITAAGIEYKQRALQEGRAPAVAELEENIRSGCAALKALTPDTTTAVSTTTTTEKVSDRPPQGSIDEARTTAQAMIDAWQAGDTGTLEDISGFNVPPTLGAPNPAAQLSGCAIEDPPLGDGTPSSPNVTAVCTISTDPPTYLWLGPDANGELRVLDASNVDGS